MLCTCANKIETNTRLKKSAFHLTYHALPRTKQWYKKDIGSNDLTCSLGS